MSLLSASPLLSSLFLTYANRAATLDGPAAPSPIDVEWAEMKTLNNRLQEEVALLRDQLNKETDRTKVAEDCVEALRAQLSSVKCANRDLETEALDERTKLDAITSEYVAYKREAKDTIAELRNTVDKEAVSYPKSPTGDLTLTPQQSARAALSQVIAEQQISLAQLKERNESPRPPPSAVKESPFALLAVKENAINESPPAVKESPTVVKENPPAVKESPSRNNRRRSSALVNVVAQPSISRQQGDLKEPEDVNQKDGTEGKDGPRKEAPAKAQPFTSGWLNSI